MRLAKVLVAPRAMGVGTGAGIVGGLEVELESEQAET